MAVAISDTPPDYDISYDPQVRLRKLVIPVAGWRPQGRLTMSDIRAQQRENFREWMERNELSVADIHAAAGVPKTTLYSYLDGKSNSLSSTTQDKLARAYETTAAEIFSPQLVPLIGYVAADAEGQVVLTEGDARTDFVLKPPGGTSQSVALEVRGFSMRGFADDGSLVYFEQQRNPPTPDMLGDIVVVETLDGRILVKRLLRGSEPGLYDLESINGPVISDCRIRWAAFPTAIVPKRHAQKIIRRSVA